LRLKGDSVRGISLPASSTWPEAAEVRASRAVRIEQYVRGLEVAVNHAALVARARAPVRDLEQHRTMARSRRRAAGADRSGGQLHGQQQRAVLASGETLEDPG